MIYVDNESTLVPKHSKNQNSDDSYANKYQKHVACIYDYGLVCVDDTFGQRLKSYLGEDALYYFINTMIKQSEYCTNIMKKYFNQELLMTKKDNEDFENSTKSCICDNLYVDCDIKVKSHCLIAEKI